MKTSFVSFLLLSLILCSSFLETSMADRPPSPSFSSSVCGKKCEVRCSKAGREDRCMKYCGICCTKCNCVPSGTYGNKAECPCYDNMKNSKGTPKCP